MRCRRPFSWTIPVAAALTIGTATAAGQNDTQLNVVQSPCSIVATGNVTLSGNIEICPGYSRTRDEIREIVEERDVDPELLRLITRADLDGALRRIEVLTAQPTPYASIYLTVAATIAAQNSLQEAIIYARRAYEANPHNGLAITRYATVLGLDHRYREAHDLITQGYRQRDLLRDIGRVYVSLAWLDITYSPAVRAGWIHVLLACQQQPCPMPPEIAANIHALRGAAQDLIRTAETMEPTSRASLRAQYYGWRYILFCDVLLRDRPAAAADEAAMLRVVEEVARRSGPWGVLVLIPVGALFDNQTPDRHLAGLYRRFEDALRDAPTAPIAPLATYLPEERWLPSISGLMLGVSRRFWAHLLVDKHRYDEAWAHSIRAIEEARPAGAVNLAIATRINVLHRMIDIPDPGSRPGGIAFMRDEYGRLERALLQEPRLVEPLGASVAQLGGQLCDADIRPQQECRS